MCAKVVLLKSAHPNKECALKIYPATSLELL